MIDKVKMTKYYLKKFIKYAKKVYHIEDGLKALTDRRNNPLYNDWRGYSTRTFRFFVKNTKF